MIKTLDLFWFDSLTSIYKLDQHSFSFSYLHSDNERLKKKKSHWGLYSARSDTEELFKSSRCSPIMSRGLFWADEIIPDFTCYTEMGITCYVTAFFRVHAPHFPFVSDIISLSLHSSRDGSLSKSPGSLWQNDESRGCQGHKNCLCLKRHHIIKPPCGGCNVSDRWSSQCIRADFLQSKRCNKARRKWNITLWQRFSSSWQI